MIAGLSDGGTCLAQRIHREVTSVAPPRKKKKGQPFSFVARQEVTSELA